MRSANEAPAVSGVVTSNFENIRQRWYFPVKNHSCLMFFDLRAKISPNDSGFMNFRSSISFQIFANFDSEVSFAGHLCGLQAVRAGLSLCE